MPVTNEESSSEFGESVGISPDETMILVGADADDTLDTDAGKVYLFSQQVYTDFKKRFFYGCMMR